MSAEPYVPEKWVWTEADFEQMVWWKTHLHAMAYIPATLPRANQNMNLAFDIDYHFIWLSNGPGQPYSIWTSPATLVFEQVESVELHIIRPGQEITIETIERYAEQTKLGGKAWLWIIELGYGHHNSSISFHTDSFKMYVRKHPVLAHPITAPYEHGDISFSCEVPQQKEELQ